MTKQHSGRFAIVPARAVEDRRLGSAGLRVLAALGTFSDKDGWCWPSLTTLAKQVNVTRQAAHQNIQQLAKLGYIEVQRRQRPDKGNAANRYRLLFDRALFSVRNELEGDVKLSLTDLAETQSGARNRSFGKRRESGARRFKPIAAMTRRVTSAPPSAAGRRSVAGFPRTVAVELRPRQAGT